MRMEREKVMGMSLAERQASRNEPYRMEGVDKRQICHPLLLPSGKLG
jgi:hypothetical protein